MTSTAHDDSMTLLTRAPGLRTASGRRVAAVALMVVGLGVLLGVLWWLAAPTARADVVQGQVYLSGHQELEVGQDGWFAVLTGLTGLLAATVLALRPGAREAVSALLAPALGIVVAVVAWRTGALLGPSSLADQVSAGDTHPSTPLQLHAYGVLLIGPFLFAVTRFLASLFHAGSSELSGPVSGSPVQQSGVERGPGR